METHHRRGAATERTGLAGGIRRLQGDPAIPRAQPRHDAVAVQGDLLVGMDPPPAGAHDGRGVPTAVSLVFMARRHPAATTDATVDQLRRRRLSWRGRLV